MNDDSFRCYLVAKDDEGQACGAVTQRPRSELPAGELLIRVAYSSLNYKDALASQGHPGVVPKLPHVPGIDAAGTVVES
jgi:acrylyl-CoA reductase (NADPH)